MVNTINVALRSRSPSQRSRNGANGRSAMNQLEMSALDQTIQALREDLQNEDDNLQRKYDDRRRPGRANYVNPNLVPLLRGEAASDLLVNDRVDPPCRLEHTTPPFPIAIYLIFTVSLWGVLGLVMWDILR